MYLAVICVCDLLSKNKAHQKDHDTQDIVLIPLTLFRSKFAVIGHPVNRIQVKMHAA